MGMTVFCRIFPVYERKYGEYLCRILSVPHNFGIVLNNVMQGTAVYMVEGFVVKDVDTKKT